MTLLRIHSEAKLERENIYKRYLEINSILPRSFRNVADKYLSLIQENPYLYAQGKLQIRRVTLRPIFVIYYIAYIIRSDVVTILAFGHSRRHPYYFKIRLKTS